MWNSYFLKKEAINTIQKKESFLHLFMERGASGCHPSPRKERRYDKLSFSRQRVA